MNQVIEQTHEEKIKMYKKCTKKALIEMLIACNNTLSAQTRVQSNYTQVSDTFSCTTTTKRGITPINGNIMRNCRKLDSFY